MARNWHQPQGSMWGGAGGGSFEWNFTIGVFAVVGGLTAAIAAVLLEMSLLAMLAVGTAVGIYLGNQVTTRPPVDPALRRASSLTDRPEASDFVMRWLDTLATPGGTVRLGDRPKYPTILTNEGVASRTRFRTISTPWSEVVSVTALDAQQRSGFTSRVEGVTYRVMISAEKGRPHAVFVSDDIVDDVVAVCRIKAREARDAT